MKINNTECIVCEPIERWKEEVLLKTLNLERIGGKETEKKKMSNVDCMEEWGARNVNKERWNRKGEIGKMNEKECKEWR